MSSSTDLVVRPEEQAMRGMEVAEALFTPERRAQIARFLNVADDEPALLPYLATCASYGLDPIMGQIWLIPQRVKIRSRDGSGEVWGERLRPSVGRDGLLAVARRDPRFRGLKFGVVCERDTFEVDHSEDNPRVTVLPWGWPDLPLVMHRQASKPVAYEDQANPAKWRGRILGAWAKCYVHGQPPEFFYAPIQEHVRMRKNKDDQMVPDGAWGYVSTMILKAAQSYVLRIAMGITGVVPADELVGGALGAVDASAQELPVETEFDWDRLDCSDEVRARLVEAVDEVNRLAPLSWSAAKLEMVLSGRSSEEIERTLAGIEAEAENLAGRALRAGAETRSGGEAGDPASGLDVPAEALTEAQLEEDDPERLRADLDEIDARLREPDVSEEDRAELENERLAIETALDAEANPDQERMEL